MIVFPKEDVHLERHVPEEIILSCELSRPNGVVSWYKDGQKLQESENIKLKIEGPYRRLKILSSGVEDSGEYVCDTADDSIFFHLNITGKCYICSTYMCIFSIQPLIQHNQQSVKKQQCCCLVKDNMMYYLVMMSTDAARGISPCSFSSYMFRVSLLSLINKQKKTKHTKYQDIIDSVYSYLLC